MLRHRLLSFGPTFILLAFLWTLVRVFQLFLAKLLDQTTWAQHALDLLPSALEFGTFSLLAMYFVYILLEQDDKWETRRSLVLVLFVSFNLFIVCLNATVFALYLHVNAARVPLWVAQVIVHCSLFVVRCSLFVVHCSLFVAVCCSLIATLRAD